MCVNCIGWIRKVATFVSPLLSNGLGSNSFWTHSDRKRVETVQYQSILARVGSFSPDSEEWNWVPAGLLKHPLKSQASYKAVEQLLRVIKLGDRFCA